jgi:tricorn protease
MLTRLTMCGLILFSVSIPVSAADRIQLPNSPALSPKGDMLAFDWEGDIWLAPSTGGLAKPLTQHPARDRQPEFSPDGKTIAFISDREGSNQIFMMPVEGGSAKQITFNTSGYILHGWTADAKLLVSSLRDHHWRNAERLYIIDPKVRKAEELLFDDYGTDGSLTTDGNRLLFTREGHQWWRKGYHGSQASQVWLYERDQKKFSPMVKEEWDARYPLWKPDGSGFYYVSGRAGVQNLFERNLQTGSEKMLTSSQDDSVVFPTLSRDGSTLVYRQLFDLYRLKPGVDTAPTKIELFADADRPEKNIDRKALESATNVAFSDDGLEIAFIAGGDLWVMDTELREPKQITKTPQDEREPIFSSDNSAIYYLADVGNGKQEVMKATRKDKTKAWFLNDAYETKGITTDGETKSNMTISPDGSKLAFVRGRGDLWVSDLEGQNAKRIVQSWNVPGYDWSPDGKWFVYALYDTDFNRDIFIQPLDGSKPAYNLSRHPYNDGDPVWSPDGKMIAFTGAREDKEKIDIHYVYLREDDDEKSSRDRTLEKALEKIQKGRATKDPTLPPRKLNNDSDMDQEPGPQPRVTKSEPKKEEGKKEEIKKEEPKRKVADVTIDFEGLFERVRRITIANSNENNLLWSPDSKKLAFSASIDGVAGLYTIEFPDNLRPSSVSSTPGSQARWLKNGSIAWLVAGVPATFNPGSGAAPTTTPTLPGLAGALGGRGFGGRSAGGSASAAATPGSYRFTAYQEVDLAKRHQAAFELAWATMRDNFYDAKLGKRNWQAVHDKYVSVAATPDPDTLAVVVQLMLGEINGSHLGFNIGASRTTNRRGGNPDEPTVGRWNRTTAHLGVRFVDGYAGPGLKIRDVIPNGPADQKKSKLKAGEIIFKIDGTPVDPKMDRSLVLNGLPNRDVVVSVGMEPGKERTVSIRPISNAVARGLLYDAWIDGNRTKVGELSKGRLGYLHIEAMDSASFHKFEEALYAAGAGKEGMVIDVRENGGGSTADLLLTALTQPKHAIAVPRDGGPGYPQDRTVFATWTKPIIVLCNQNSYSNAEIFSHAIKTLKRGKLVGVPTAGGVISTGGTTIMDVGFLRLPFRGWYKVDDGEDMELNGAVPDLILWPQPTEMPAGIDRQLEKAVQLLLMDVETEKSKPQPKLRKATDR